MNHSHDDRFRRFSAERAFTLVELMTVVAIIGVMVSLAAVAIANEPTVEDIGHRISGLVEEASRKAVSGGSMTAAAIASEGTKARSRVRIYGAARNQTMITERYDDSVSEWRLVSTYRIPPHIEVVGFRERVELDPGTGPAYALGGGHQVHLECFPSGTCLPEAPGSVGMTVYLRDIDDPIEEARIVVIPVGVPMVLSGW